MTIKALKPQNTKLPPLKHYYFDPKLLEEDMPESTPHRNLIRVLEPLLIWLYRDKNFYITGNLDVIRKTAKINIQIAPDIVVFKNLDLSDPKISKLTSWRIGSPNRPAPAVVFEIASKKTWTDDLSRKIIQYGQMGVQEYFAYDPNTPTYWDLAERRIRGWSYIKGLPVELSANDDGWMWSRELETWLEPNGAYLRLRGIEGNLRLNEAEQREADERQARTQAEQREANERQARLAELQAKLEAERKLAEALAKLEELSKPGNA